jgi:hypothetical protein
MVVRSVALPYYRILLALTLIALFGEVTPPPVQAANPPLPLKVNFQPLYRRQDPQRVAVLSDLPAGYVRDYGLAFGSRVQSETGSATPYTFGWVQPGTNNPIDLSAGSGISTTNGITITGNARDRNNANADQRYDTFIHMQGDTLTTTLSPGSNIAGAWELQLDPGTYRVTVAVGDPSSAFCPDPKQPERHMIYLENVLAINNFVGSRTLGVSSCHRTVTRKVQVNDGRLTVSALGAQGNGYNTKISFIDVAVDDGTPLRPSVSTVRPFAGSTNVRRDEGVVATLDLPNGGLNYDTVNANTVKLTKVISSTSTPVPFRINTTGGGDVISLTPVGFLDPNTQYRFEITDGVKDLAGQSMSPFVSTFTTGTTGGPTAGAETISFRQTKSAGTIPAGNNPTSLVFGPDGKLYVGTLEGNILRYTLAADGTLGSPQIINTIRNRESSGRLVIGLAFDPASTAENLVLWVSHNGPYSPATDNPDWTGRVARLSGANLENFQNYVINLPHAVKDHMANSLAFGPDGKLYIPVGSNSSMGEKDSAWGLRPERLLSGTLLQIDIAAITSPPLNAKTPQVDPGDAPGSYDPFAPSAPVKIYASGLRNAYDLVFHSNGQLYLPTNGSGGGGNAPAIPADVASRPECQRRVNGQPYNGPTSLPYVPQNTREQKDWLFRVEQGGYYGHPNPLLCEYIAHGGNPTVAADPGEVAAVNEGDPTGYPVGVQPDPNWRGAAFDFGLNISPNGAVEYKNAQAFNGALKGQLLVTRFSQRDDIIALKPSGTSGELITPTIGIPGFSNLNNPLDLIEHPSNGSLYVVEFGPPSTITLLAPLGEQTPQIELTPGQVVQSDVVGGAASANTTVSIRNTGNSDLVISQNGIQLVGADAADFQVSGVPPLPYPIAPGSAAAVQVSFNPTTPGVKSTTLRVTSNAKDRPTAEVQLRGLATPADGEPSLQWILDTYQIPVDVGDKDPATSVIEPADQPGDELPIQTFVQADIGNPVTTEPLAMFASGGLRFGWYTAAGTTITRTEQFSITSGAQLSDNGLAVGLSPDAKLSFDPAGTAFGLYAARAGSGGEVYSENTRNGEGEGAQRMRVYRLKNSDGSVVQNAYIVAIRQQNSGASYQDFVLVMRNVKPADPALQTVSLYLPTVLRR